MLWINFTSFCVLLKKDTIWSLMRKATNMLISPLTSHIPLSVACCRWQTCNKHELCCPLTFPLLWKTMLRFFRQSLGTRLPPLFREKFPQTWIPSQDCWCKRLTGEGRHMAGLAFLCFIPPHTFITVLVNCSPTVFLKARRTWHIYTGIVAVQGSQFHALSLVVKQVHLVISFPWGRATFHRILNISNVTVSWLITLKWYNWLLDLFLFKMVHLIFGMIVWYFGWYYWFLGLQGLLGTLPFAGP